jgi:lipoprotein NlpD
MKQDWLTTKFSNLRAVLIASAILLTACASDPSVPVPIEDLSIGAKNTNNAHGQRPTNPSGIAGSYRVVKGDTLYAIAFKHGLDYRDLAAWNGVVAPYRIYAGQELRLNPLQESSAVAVTSAIPDRTAVAKVDTLPAAPQNSRVENVPPPVKPVVVAKPPVANSAPPPIVENAKAPEEVPAKSAAVVAEAPPVTTTKPADVTAQLNAGGVTWRWPSNGKVVGTYVSGDQIRQGIDIAGNAGDPVMAAADGEVVYSGNGLLGYGELIIIKHNASFLSAYGHNRKRLVQEGGKVKAGQQIAEMGSSASSREELHFEIRKNGKPVNPLDYLPVR